MEGLWLSPSTSRFKNSYRGLLVAIWLQCALVFMSQHFVATTSAAKFQIHDHEQMEFRRSMARHQQERLHLLQDSTDSEVLQQVPEEPEESWGDAETFTYANPYHLGAVINDWDEQRAAWLARHARTKQAKDNVKKPSVLLVTGSQPAPCNSPEGDHFHLKALKNKLDYARMHDFEVFYNFLFLDPLFTGVWAKLPIFRKLMLTHPEVEWFIWMDSDAIFTDMLFEIPFHEYDDYNLVIWTWIGGFENKDWVSVNDGVFLLRNCQWSLDLFDKWSPLGPKGKIRDEAGKFLSSFLSNRREDFPADDQSALMYVMLKDKEVMDKIKLLEKEYRLHGYWVMIVDHYEKFMATYHPGLGDCRWPLVTHFTGCSPCSGYNNPDYPLQMCMDNFERAFNFADNQVMAYLGYQHESLSSSEVVRIRNDTSEPIRYVGVNPYEERIAQVKASGIGKPDDCY